MWFIPISREVTGKTGRCDFCERPIDRVVGTQEVALDEWSFSDGLDTLVGKLAASGEIPLPEGDSDTRLHSLLAAAKEASSINKLDITFGLTTGVILGIALGVLAGIYLFDSGIMETQLDKFEFVLASAWTGIAGGGVIGVTLQALFKRGKVAFTKINAACTNYRLDTVQLEKLSRQHGRVVRRAVRAVRDATGRAPYDT